MAEIPLSRPAAACLGASLRRARESSLARRTLALALLVLGWEAAAALSANPIMLPGPLATLRALADAVLTDGLLASAWVSVSVLVKGYALAVGIALALVALAVANRFARDALQMLTAMLNPLPAIALLPLALLWFGLGEAALLFVLCHAVVWPFALAALQGFETTPETQRLVGRNYGLAGAAFVGLILIPAALPALLSGLRIGWAFAWRTLIAAELVFGVASSSGGLGWFVFVSRNELHTDKVFAGLVVVILIGLAVELGLFRTVENRTVRRWGMQR